MLNLSRLEALEQLTLALNCESLVYFGQNVSWNFNAYAFILRTSPPPALQTLTVKLYINDDSNEMIRRRCLESFRRVYLRPSWVAFDSAIQALPTSPQVIFDCVGPWEDVIQCGAMGECLQEVLPRTHARGLLRWTISVSVDSITREDRPRTDGAPSAATVPRHPMISFGRQIYGKTSGPTRSPTQERYNPVRYSYTCTQRNTRRAHADRNERRHT